MQKRYNFNKIGSLTKIDLNHTVDNIYLAIEIAYCWNCFQPRISINRIVYFICIIAPQLKDNNCNIYNLPLNAAAAVAQ